MPEEAPIHGPAVFPALESLGLCTGLGGSWVVNEWGYGFL